MEVLTMSSETTDRQPLVQNHIKASSKNPGPRAFHFGLLDVPPLDAFPPTSNGQLLSKHQLLHRISPD